ncbi:MAG TPA: Rrf2 family transcriptional regulator [Fibrobacteria bacterium]|nr:Rrf2 family transcriptional regulator [Fibrobacteria bacterium]
MLSKKGKYAIQACLDLAKQEAGKPNLIADIAERAAIPKKFLEIILLDLRNVGILSSKKGKGGGYHLSRDPAKVMLGQIIRLMDGPLAPVACVSQTAFRPCEDCPDPASCGIKMVMKDVRDSIATILDNTSLADVLERSRRGAENAPVFYDI